MKAITLHICAHRFEVNRTDRIPTEFLVNNDAVFSHDATRRVYPPKTPSYFSVKPSRYHILSIGVLERNVEQ